MSDDRAGAGEGPDAGADSKARDEREQGGLATTGTDNASGGEDDSSTEKEGDDSHLHDDQKSRPLGT
ncbi:MAG: hypothetical protein EOO81_08835 [Oxalobacteraceae bacterium]|nr:MAG: hypothetical protein EOO81_08835 [Oxalobacteraceae bacterium]